MGTLGKTMAVLNGVAAFAFLVLAAIDYGQRHPWEIAVVQQDFLIRGLPVDDTDKDAEGRPIVSLLNQTMLQKLFAGAGQPVRTQMFELKSRHDALLQQAADNKALEAILVPLARSVSEREVLRQQIAKGALEDLKGPDGPFEAAFKEVNNAKSIEAKREAIAHILCNTAQGQQEQQRALVVCGMTAFVQEVDSQAALLASMAPQLQLMIANERTEWEVNRKALLQDIMLLAERVRDLDERLHKAEELRDQRHKMLVQARQANIEELTKQIASTKQKLVEETTTQSALEAELLGAHKAAAEAAEQNRQLEQEIKKRELGR